MMRHTLVLDSWAILAFVGGEGAASTMVRRLFRRAQAGNLRLVVQIVNLGEVYYRCIEKVGAERADEVIRWLHEAPIEIAPAREALVLEAGRLKAAHPMAYADAFAVATARLEPAPIVTGDPEIYRLPRSVVEVRKLVR